MAVPSKIWLYHITHVNNLAAIMQAGGLWSDSKMRENVATHEVIGYDHIKKRRLGLPVRCHTGTMVGEYVPFYFCPRSAMLYVIHNRNFELTYRGGQESILHLAARLSDVVAWSEQNGIAWAFSTSNAGSPLATFYADLGKLDKINWAAVNAHYWSECRDEKQAEFLVYQWFPFSLFSVIVTINEQMKQRVEGVLGSSGDAPSVNVKPKWYYGT